jgi:hypothetical protein
MTGPTPLLPDWAVYGTWYTRYIAYTEEEAKEDAGNWTTGEYPLDVWALDMEWGNTRTMSRKSGARTRRQTDSSPICQIFAKVPQCRDQSPRSQLY